MKNSFFYYFNVYIILNISILIYVIHHNLTIDTHSHLNKDALQAQVELKIGIKSVFGACTLLDFLWPFISHESVLKVSPSVCTLCVRVFFSNGFNGFAPKCGPKRIALFGLQQRLS